MSVVPAQIRRHFLNPPPCWLFSSLALWLSLSQPLNTCILSFFVSPLPSSSHLLFLFSLLSPSPPSLFSLPSLALHLFAPRSLLPFLFLALPHDLSPSHLLHRRCPPTVAASVSPCCDSPSPPAQDPSNRRLTLINCLTAEPVSTVPQHLYHPRHEISREKKIVH